AHADEQAYNAAVCAGRAGSVDAAIDDLDVLSRARPGALLAIRALALRGTFEAQRAHYADAASAFEQLARSAPGGRKVRDALIDAIAYRRALGDLTAAGRDVELGAKLYRDRVFIAALPIALARDRLDRGDRRGAARALATIVGAAHADELAGAPVVALLWN